MNTFDPSAFQVVVDLLPVVVVSAFKGRGDWYECPYCRSILRDPSLCDLNACDNPGCDAAPHITPHIASHSALRIIDGDGRIVTTERKRIMNPHYEYVQKNPPARPCSAADMTFEGRCMNCGYDCGYDGLVDSYLLCEHCGLMDIGEGHPAHRPDCVKEIRS